jgi:predicted O-methyltransferase YrrM
VKTVYVRLARLVRGFLRAVWLLPVLDRWAARSRAGAWARSLLSIFDLRELAAADTPWWTYESAARVEGFLARRPDATVFEWGSGASTVWLAKRAAHVIAVEHDTAWAEQVRPLLSANATVQVVPPTPARPGAGISSAKPGHEGLDFTDYVYAIDAYDGPFDLIVVDGRAREACLKRALPKLADQGLLVFDNVDRSRYRAAIEAEPDLDVVITRGLTPALPYPNRTALITRVPR